MNFSCSLIDEIKITSLFALFFIGIASVSNSQFIENKKGQITQGEDFFNPNEIKKKNIKTLEITYFEKKALQGIFQIHGKTDNYLFDNQGKISRKYKTQESYGQKKDTLVEWRFYKNNRLSTIKSGRSKIIKTRSIFYEEDRPAIHILGRSINKSKNLIDLKISSYKEESAIYINYKTLKNKDTLVEWCKTGKTVFKRINISKIDSVTNKETVIFPLKNMKYYSNEFSYKNSLLEKITEQNSDNENFYFHFYYSSDKELMGFSKFNLNTKREIEVTEIIYDENTGNLQAILTKNKINSSFKIRKFNYTYF